MYIEMVNRLETEKSELVKIVQQDDVAGLKKSIYTLEQQLTETLDSVDKTINEYFLNVTLDTDEFSGGPVTGIRLLQVYLRA
jgi:hypothetical protein